MEKLTKKEIYEGIRKYYETGSQELDVDVVVEFCTKEIAALDAKAVKAKERAAAKKAEADELMVQVQDALTDEFQTIADIYAAIEGANADATVSRITYRLSKLVESGLAERTEVTVAGVDGGKSRKVKAFKAVVTE